MQSVRDGIGGTFYRGKCPRRPCRIGFSCDGKSCLLYTSLFVEENGKEEIRLIDWEYAGMQDPHVDIAMFCIYSLYKKEQVDHLIDLYFEGNCDDRTRIKIYCYIAVCGLLWSNWCEYKRKLGVEFGEYSLRQYRYAKDYYKIVQQELGEEGKETCTK